MEITNSILAILGGQAAVPPHLQKMSHPCVGPFDSAAILDQLRDQISIYDGGGIYRRLESEVGEKWSLEHVLSVNSGTSALFSMYYSLGLNIGDEVVVPAYTFFATATPLFLLGLVPVLADAASNGNIDPGSVEACISARTKAIVATHMWGIPCDLDGLTAIAKRHGIPLLEDVSHAHGARYHGRYVGSFSDGAAWSLQGKKIWTAGEGGLFATRHEEMYQRAVLVGHYNKRAREEVTISHLKPLASTGTGLNLRMHPLAAALALSQFARLEQQLAERREVAQYLTAEISKIEGLSLPAILAETDPAWYAFPILYEEKKFSGLSKASFVKALHAEGALEIDIPRSTCPLTEYELFRNPASLSARTFPGADSFHYRVIKTPVWYGEKRFDYANAYLQALRKVAAHRRDLL